MKEQKEETITISKKYFTWGGTALIIILLCSIIFYLGSNLVKSTVDTNPKKDQLNELKKTKNPPKIKIECIRENLYPIAPEFKRALSLIDQRLSVNVAKIIYNCLDIRYSTEADGVGAEGIFVFNPEQVEDNKLTILVSPRYQNQSDLLTAFLLSHEISHAVRYYIYSTGSSNVDLISSEGCFEDEALAFTNQLLFLGSLNKGELNSLVAVITSDNEFLSQSQEINFLKNYFFTIGSSDFDKCVRLDFSEMFSCSKEKFLNIVKSEPYYQEQCNR